MGWDKRRKQGQRKMMSCMIKNQVAMMTAMKTQLERSLSHSLRYGSDITNILKDRIEKSK